MPLIAQGLIVLAILGALGTLGYKVRQSGFDACTVQRDKNDQKAVAEAEADRARQDALRSTQDKEATRRLANARKQSAALYASLEAHIAASGAAASFRLPDSLRDDWNAANAGPQGVGPGPVPPASRPAPPAR